jgi:hypothetical protein
MAVDIPWKTEGHVEINFTAGISGGGALSAALALLPAASVVPSGQVTFKQVYDAGAEGTATARIKCPVR